MISILSLIIFILLINENICFESSDICLQTDLECQGISDPFNNYKNHCKCQKCKFEKEKKDI